jgi:predicted RNase H-like HicB family nuclease
MKRDNKYTIEITWSEDGYYAKVLELQGCCTAANTLSEVLVMVNDAIELWEATAQELGL